LRIYLYTLRLLAPNLVFHRVLITEEGFNEKDRVKDKITLAVTGSGRYKRASSPENRS